MIEQVFLRGKNLTPAVRSLVPLVIIAAVVSALALHAVLYGPAIQERAERLQAELRLLERENMLALRAIKELEFDRAMGKLSESDWQEMSGRLRARAARLMRQLDAGAGYREQVEKDLAKRLGSTPSAADAEAPVARFCASCGTARDADAKFCKNCGTKL